MVFWSLLRTLSALTRWLRHRRWIERWLPRGAASSTSLPSLFTAVVVAMAKSVLPWPARLFPSPYWRQQNPSMTSSPSLSASLSQLLSPLTLMATWTISSPVGGSCYPASIGCTIELQHSSNCSSFSPSGITSHLTWIFAGKAEI